MNVYVHVFGQRVFVSLAYLPRNGTVDHMVNLCLAI